MKKPEAIRFDDFGTYQCLEDIKNNSVDLCLVTCGMERCLPLHSFGPGKRCEYIFHFVTEGTGYVHYEGCTYRLGAGDIFLICPDKTIHYQSDSSDPWNYMWIGFLGIKAPLYVRYAGYDDEHITGHFENYILIKEYIRQMIDCRFYTPGNELKRNAALMEILALLIDDAGDNGSPVYHLQNQEYIEQAKAYIEANYQHELNVAAIAEYVGIDRSYLSRLFKKIIGLSPLEYIRQFRLDRATLLMQNPDYNITFIARSVGYNDYITFSRLFKEFKGMSPTEYRKGLPH